MEPRCEDCKFYRELEHNFVQGKGFEKSHCCVLFEYYLKDIEPIDKGLIVEVSPGDCCEVFSAKEKRII